MPAAMLQLCGSSVRNANALGLKSKSSFVRSIVTARPGTRRVVTKRTHFLNLPLYQGSVSSKLAELRQLWRQDLDSAQLEPGVIIPSIYHALSLKLGNINIKGCEGSTITAPFDPNSPQPQEEPPAFELDEVVQAMEELKEPIRQLLASYEMNNVLRVPLGSLIPLLHGREEHFNPRKVNVLFLRPTEGRGLDIVNAICKLVHEKFTPTGMLAGAPLRPAVANLTLINTANRPNYVRTPGVARKPFNLLALYQLEGFKSFRPDGSDAVPARLDLPLNVNLGEAEVRSLKLDRVTPGVPNDETKPECEAEVTFAT